MHITRPLCAKGSIALALAMMPCFAMGQDQPATRPATTDAEWRAEMERRMQQLEQENRELREKATRVADTQQALIKEAEAQGRLTIVEGGQPRLTQPDWFDINKFASEGDWPGSIRIPKLNTSFQLGGFVQLDATTDTDRIDNQDGFVVHSIETGASKTGAGDTNFSVRQTRLFFKTQTPTQNWGNLITYIETDFFGTDGTEIRLRHAYGQVGDKFQLLAGQTWSAFQDASVFPASLDAQGPPGIITSRRPQLRVRQEWSKQWAGVLSVEDPSSELTTPAGDVGFDSTPYPDLDGNVRWTPAWGHLQLAGVLRYLQFDPDVGSRASTMGYGLNLTGSVNTIKLDDKHIDSILFQVAGGNGIARYVNDTGGLGLDGVLAAPGAALDGLPLFAGVIAYQHWWHPKWGSTFAYSIVQVDNDSAQVPGTYHSGQYVIMNIRYYPAERVMLGFECLFGVRENNDGTSGDDLRLQFSAQYRF